MKLTIRAKVTLAFVIIIGIVLGLGTYSLNMLNVINDQSTVIAANWLPSVDVAHSINTMTSDFRIMEYRHILASSKAEMEQLEKDMEAKKAEIE